MDPAPLFAREAFRNVAGQALRPGGVALTSLALDHCFLPPGALVADIGCGRGASLALLSERGFKAVGIDPSPDLLAEAMSALTVALSPGHQLIRGAAEALPLARGAFAAVLCECVLSVTRDPDAALAEMRRILTPGGLLMISDLYLRDPVDSGTGRPAGCPAGAVSRGKFEERLDRTGFIIRVFEDHSRLLAELAGRLVFAGFDRADLGCGCSGSGRPGYFLCIAQAEDS